MSKLTNLYYAHLNERSNEMSTFVNGSEFLRELKIFLQTKLNAKNFLKAEELLSQALNEAKEDAFKEGAKYTFDLGLELSGKNKE